jgi:WD40 repeat protein
MAEVQERRPEEAVSEHRGHDVFVSYSRADRNAVVRLTGGLASKGKRAWVDLDDIPPSAEWMAEIRQAIEGADGYLVAISPDVARSKVCSEELEHARSAGKRIVPVLVRTTDPDSVPESLASLNWIDATDGSLESAVDRIVQALDTDLEHVKAHTRLLVRASEWEKRDQDRSLLLRGQDLKQAEGLLVQAQGKEPAPTPVQARYVQASRQGASRRQRITVGAVAIALVVSLVLSAVALVQRSEAREAQARAEEQANVANSRALAAQALVHMDRDLDLAVLLSLEAYRTAPTQEALDVLHIAAQRSYMIERTIAGSEFDGVGFTPEGGKKAVVYSPDGELIASGDTQGNVSVWEADTGDEVGEPFPAAVGAVYAIAFSPDAGTLAVGGEGGIVSRWNPLTGAEAAPRLEFADPVTALAFSPDARRIAVGTDEGDLSLFDTDDGSLLAGPEEFGRRESDFNLVSGVAFSPDGTAMAVGALTGELVLVDPETLQRTDELQTNTIWLGSPEFSPDGRTVAAGIIGQASGADGEVLLWDVVSGRLLERLKGHTDQVFDVSFSPNGSRLASASADRTVRLWDVVTGEQVGEPLLGHSAAVHAVMFDPTGTDLVSASADGSIIAWNAGSRVVGEGGAINAVAFTSDGSRLLSAGPFSYAEPFPPDPTLDGGGDVQIWDTSTWVPVGDPIHGQYDYGLAVAPDDSWFAGATFFGRVPRWPIEPSGTDLDTLRVPSDLPYPEGILLSLAVSPDGGTIAATGFGGVFLWDAATGAPVHERLVAHDGGTAAAVFSPDGRTLVSGGFEDGRVLRWDAATWEPIGEPLAKGLQRVFALAFSPDGSMFAAGGYDGSVIVWDTSSWKRVHEVAVEDLVLSLAFSPDERVLAAGTSAGEVEFIDVGTGERIGETVPGQRDYVNSVAFAPDGETLVAGSQDGSIALLGPTAWTDDVAALGETLCRVAGRGLTEDEWAEFVPFKPYDAGCPPLDASA